MNRYNSTLVALIILTTVLVTGIYTTNVPTVFADSRILKQETKQTANCDTIGAYSTVSDSCNQQSANNVNNGVPKTGGTSGNPTGALLITKSCVASRGGSCTSPPTFNVQVTGNNPQPPSFSLTDAGSQSVTLGTGSFTVTEAAVFGYSPSFSGDCMRSAPGSNQATGTIIAGQQPTCDITNTALPSTILFNVDCNICVPGDKVITITGNNPQPPSFLSGDQISQLVTLDPGNYEITISGGSPADIRFTGDCGNFIESNGPVFQFSVTGTISAGQSLHCHIHYAG
jgi:hypothetical protein